MDDYEIYLKDCKKIRANNEKLLHEFEMGLEADGLSQKTVEQHFSNISFYVNEFLLYEGAVEAKDGADDVSRFLGNWFIRKALWSSESSIKSNITSLKKFYTFMFEKGLIDRESLDDLKETIKAERPEWLASVRRYANPSIAKAWGF